MTLGARVLRVICCAAILIAAGSVRAGDPESLETRIFDVSAMTRGSSFFVPDRGPFGPAPDQVNDSANPFFGAEGEERVKPYGTIEDLVELVRWDAVPGTWNRDGHSIAANGIFELVARGSSSALDRAEALLARLEVDALACLTVDALALEGDPAAAGGEGGIPGALGRGELRLLAAARTSAFSGQRVTAFSGGHQAYLQDYDVEVAEGASTMDPIVGVQPDGLCLDVRPLLVGDSVLLEGKAWLARVASLDLKTTSEGDVFEAAVVDGRAAAFQLVRARPGDWVALPSSDNVLFALRVAVRPSPARGKEPPLSSLAPSAALGSLTTYSWPVGDLMNQVQSTRGRVLGLGPSNYTPPEPPELPEPAAFVSSERLVGLAKALVDPFGWEREGTTLEVKERRLLAVTDEAHARGIEALLADLRRRFLRALMVRATVVSLPLASFPELVSGLDDGATLASDGGAALLARAGAHVEGRAHLRVPPRARTGEFQGRVRAYVGDYDVEIAPKTSIGNPIVKQALEGTSLDMDAALASGGTSASLEMRWDRSTWRGKRSIKTRHGDIELPSLGIQRMRGSCVVPLGSTRILSLAIEDGRAVLVLLTVTEG